MVNDEGCDGEGVERSGKGGRGINFHCIAIYPRQEIRGEISRPETVSNQIEPVK